MQVTVQRLTSRDRAHLGELWHAATNARRRGLGLDDLPPGEGSALDRPGAFGVGVFDGRSLVAAAVALLHWSALGGLADPVEPELLPVLRRLDPHGAWRTQLPRP